jgi:hypothetical protein
MASYDWGLKMLGRHYYNITDGSHCNYTASSWVKGMLKTTYI